MERNIRSIYLRKQGYQYLPSLPPEIYSQSKQNQCAVNRERHRTRSEYPQIGDKQTRNIQM